MNLSKILSKATFQKVSLFPNTLLKHSFKVNNIPKASLKMQLNQWHISSKEPLSKPHIYMVSSQITHEISLRSFYEPMKTNTIFTLHLGKEITQPQKTHLIQGMEKFFVCLIRLDSELLQTPCLVAECWLELSAFHHEGEEKALSKPTRNLFLVFNHLTQCWIVYLS